MCLNGSKLLSCDILAVQPGTMSGAAFVEFECKAQPPNKVLLVIESAGGAQKVFGLMVGSCRIVAWVELLRATEGGGEDLVVVSAR